MKTSMIYGFAITNATQVEKTLREIGDKISATQKDTVFDVESFVLYPQETEIPWPSVWPGNIAKQLIIEKLYDEVRHEQVLLIYPQKLKFNSSPGVTTIDTNFERESWGIVELFTAIMGWDKLPQFHLVTL